ncbi:MAG: hypothetical protein KJN64_02020 [Ignavibacteria bacterium]|nr:hypothetical protein [Ignavibacteria bacterium]MBT8383324.1 hypothetical protein [Ignavibacteria bacterium]MBT8391396.1 hypothetical protein [Ignavibacteria bacterium]NNJ52426.1 hypothetical protein [Ignavibacteriaceae bacterium]NNL19834.1 hypothetical protein [Ignavibacteriaceae bacterium]
MNKMQIIIAASMSTLVFLSCTSQKSTSEFPYGSYSYKSFNIAGELIGDGTFYISIVDSNIIEGNWAIRNVRNCYVCGPQYGNGYLTGKIENDSLFINLNPDNRDNYVELVGMLDDETFTGDWRWFELVVNSNRGTFKAVRM